MDNNENGVQIPNEGADTQQKSVDYEKEFKALTEKYNSLNNDYMKKSDAYDKVSSENADYKRKERDKMSDEEKKAKELQDLIDSKNKMEAELQEIKLEREFFGNGFTTEESAKLKAYKIPIEAVKAFAEIVKTRVEDAIKSVRAESIKDGTKLPMSDTTSEGKTKSNFQLRQESKKKTENIIKFN